MAGTESGKIKALQGGLQGLGADRKSYLLPQVVGETSGMRGEGTTSQPPSRNFRQLRRALGSYWVFNNQSPPAIP
jgi:hypothetical protein